MGSLSRAAHMGLTACFCCPASHLPAGVRGLGAVQRSRALLRRLRWQLAVPFVALVVSGRLLEAAKGALLNIMPPR